MQVDFEEIKRCPKCRALTDINMPTDPETEGSVTCPDTECGWEIEFTVECNY